MACYQVASRTLAVTGLFWNSCGQSWLIWYCNTIPVCHFGCVTHNGMLLITYKEPFFFFLSSTSNRILIESYQVYGFAWSQSFFVQNPMLPYSPWWSCVVLGFGQTDFQICSIILMQILYLTSWIIFRSMVFSTSVTSHPFPPWMVVAMDMLM